MEIKKAYGEYVIIRPEKIESFLSDEESAPYKEEGEVLAVGEKVTTISVGDRVNFQGKAAVAVDYQGERIFKVKYDYIAFEV